MFYHRKHPFLIAIVFYSPFRSHIQTILDHNQIVWTKTLEIARGLAGLGASPSRPVRLEVTTLSANPTAKTTIGYRGEASGAIVPERRAYTLPSPSSLLAMKIKPYSVTLVVSR